MNYNLVIRQKESRILEKFCLRKSFNNAYDYI